MRGMLFLKITWSDINTVHLLQLGSINQSSDMDSYVRSDTVHFTKIVFKKLSSLFFLPNLTFYYDDPEC